MSHQYEVTVLIVGGDKKSDISPPLNDENKLKKFHSQIQTPFDVENEEEIKDYLREKFGSGYYRVYSPGHYEKMKRWFKGEVREW